MFYANFIKLCGKIGKSPSAVAVELGFKKSTVTRWKGGSTPTDTNAQIIADYFGITVSELMEDEKKPTPVSESGQIPNYELLSDENRLMIDGLIAKLLASQSDGQQ